MDGFDLATIIKIIAGSHLCESAYETDNRITYAGTGTCIPGDSNILIPLIASAKATC